MRGNVEAIKERLDIAEVIGGYVKLEKAGANFKAKCPFHSEKTASFLISPTRQSYYCFGCGAKGDIFTFVEEMDGVDFKGALRTLADRAGIELTYERGENKGDKDKLYAVLEDAALYFEEELRKNSEVMKYLLSRGLSEESIILWRLGYARAEWRVLREHLMSRGYTDDIMAKAGLIKRSEDHKDKEPYDTFRDRIIFPLSDPRGKIIAFSGRAFGQETEPKYLNSPDTALFTKGEVLYGLDKAREDIRRKDYAVLVEGQMDLTLSHQAGVSNTVASSGTAFTELHLERLKRLSPRIILAFDGDVAGSKAAEKSAALALFLGMEVKIAKMPEGKDPADMVRESPESWKDALRKSKPAIEVFLDEIVREEKDIRKAGKLIERRILPLMLLVQSAMERSHYVSLIAKRTGMKEGAIVEDLRRAKSPLGAKVASPDGMEGVEKRTGRTRIEELEEVMSWLRENPKDKDLLKHESELRKLLSIDELDREIAALRLQLDGGDDEALQKITSLTKKRDMEKRQNI